MFLDPDFKTILNPKRIICLHKIIIKDKPIFLLFIYKTQKDKKPLHAFYVKDLIISIESTRILSFKFFNVQLKYEAESSIHAQDWFSAINKYKNPQSYERPLNLKKDSIIIDQEIMPSERQFPPPPDSTVPIHCDLSNKSKQSSLNELIKSATASTSDIVSANINLKGEKHNVNNLMNEMTGRMNNLKKPTKQTKQNIEKINFSLVKTGCETPSSSSYIIDSSSKLARKQQTRLSSC